MLNVCEMHILNKNSYYWTPSVSERLKQYLLFTDQSTTSAFNQWDVKSSRFQDLWAHRIFTLLFCLVGSELAQKLLGKIDD